MTSRARVGCGDSHTRLNAADMRVLPLLAKGLSNAEIGRQSGYSAHHVASRVSHMNAAFGTHNRLALVVEAMRRGLVRPWGVE
jgi:DNA-binding NarL/FixJ family response regulator